MARLGSPVNTGQGRASLEDLGAAPKGLGELFGRGEEDNYHLYLFTFTSPNKKVQDVKVGKAVNVLRRLSEVRVALNATGRYKDWEVVCRRAELLGGKFEERVLEKLRSLPRSKAKGYPTFGSHRGGSGESEEVFRLPYTLVSKAVSEAMHDAFLLLNWTPDGQGAEEADAEEEPAPRSGPRGASTKAVNLVNQYFAIFVAANVTTVGESWADSATSVNRAFFKYVTEKEGEESDKLVGPQSLGMAVKRGETQKKRRGFRQHSSQASPL